MSVRHQKIHAVCFAGYGVFLGCLKDADCAHGHFIATSCSAFCSDAASDRKRRFHSERRCSFEGFAVLCFDYALAYTRAVSDEQEDYLAPGTFAVEPPLQDNVLSLEMVQFTYGGCCGHGALAKVQDCDILVNRGPSVKALPVSRLALANSSQEADRLSQLFSYYRAIQIEVGSTRAKQVFLRGERKT